jgi:hypothetical protein
MFAYQRLTSLSFSYRSVPVPWDLFDDAPAYFREGILASESEWSQHKKLIDFSARPGGFRRALVANLPYFMVQWDYKGEKGFGHVIEGVDEGGGKAGDAEDQGIVDEGDKGGKFPRLVLMRRDSDGRHWLTTVSPFPAQVLCGGDHRVHPRP